MIDLSAAATVAVGGAVLCLALKIVVSGMDAYELGYRDGQDTMRRLLLGGQLQEFVKWDERRREQARTTANKGEPNANE